MTRPPRVDGSSRADVLGRLLARVPGHTPEWSPEPGTSGAALLEIFARYREIVAAALDEAPDRSQLAFLDMLGIAALPAQDARVPLVFTLMEESPVDVPLPANTQVAASRPALLPTPGPSGDPAPVGPAIFTVAQTITLARARLAALYSIDPDSDRYADHTAEQRSGFTLFTGMRRIEHAIYLGHDQLFDLPEGAEVLLSFDISAGSRAEVRQDLRLAWEYLSVDEWRPLESPPVEGLVTNGQVTLRKGCGSASRKEKIQGRASYWIRGQLLTPLPPTGTDGAGRIPVIDGVRVRVGYTREGLEPEAGFQDLFRLDLSKPFLPFGPQPAPQSTFYLAGGEVFERKGARVRLHVEMESPGVLRAPVKLGWEYFDGTGWSPLGVIPSPASGEEAFNFDRTADVRFDCPEDWAESEVAGVKGYWLRVRIVDGDFGLPTRVVVLPTRAVQAVSADGREVTVDSTVGYSGGEVVTFVKGWNREARAVVRVAGSTKLVLEHPLPANPDYTDGRVGSVGGTSVLAMSTLHPPLVGRMSLSYTYLTEPTLLDHVLSSNEFVLEDHTAAARWPKATFVPFRAAADRRPAVYLGFDRALPAGLVSLYAHAPPRSPEGGADEGSTDFVWEYLSARGWVELSVQDGTVGFRRSGLIQFVGPREPVRSRGLGGELYRVRARLVEGERPREAVVAGIWTNAVWASHRRAYVRELLGLSEGHPRHALRFAPERAPVLAGERLEVREWVGGGRGWEGVAAGVPEEEVRRETDPAPGVVREVWVRWEERPHLYASGPADRHYTLERSRGVVRFGDGRHGMIPPAGSQVAVSYSTGGGLAGNLPARAISELRTAVPYLMSAENPVPSLGGAATESIGTTRARGPHRLRHADRAISPSDVEALALEASPAVARARCLPVTGPAGREQRGWVTVLVIPWSLEARPLPDPELERRVREHLGARAPTAVSRRIRVIGPQYLPVSVTAEIVPAEPGLAAAVELEVRAALDRFLHPLHGGVDGRGWTFGEPVYLSQAAAVVAGTRGVDQVRELRLQVEGRLSGEVVPGDPDALVASGDHEIRVTLGRD